MTVIAYGADATYLPFACFSIKSICEHNAAPPDIYLLTVDVSAAEIAKARSYLDRLPVRVHFCDPPDFDYEHTQQRISRAAYLRLGLGDLLPDQQRVLYLDGDTRVAGDLTPLLNADLRGKTVAATHDIIALQTDHFDELRTNCELVGDQSYFNSGVMLIDLDRWRRHEIGERAARFAVAHPERCRYFDQCALNKVLVDDWAPLEQRWNYLAFMINTETPVGRLRVPEIAPAIYHYAGNDKPWEKLVSPTQLSANRWYVRAARDSPWPELAQPPSLLQLLRIQLKRATRELRGRLRQGAHHALPALLSDRTHRRIGVRLIAEEAIRTNDPAPLIEHQRAA